MILQIFLALCLFFIGLPIAGFVLMAIASLFATSPKPPEPEPRRRVKREPEPVITREYLLKLAEQRLGPMPKQPKGTSIG